MTVSEMESIEPESIEKGEHAPIEVVVEGNQLLMAVTAKIDDNPMI